MRKDGVVRDDFQVQVVTEEDPFADIDVTAQLGSLISALGRSVASREDPCMC